MVLTRQRTDVDFGGNLTIIDANHFVENTQTTLAAAGTRRPRADACHAQRRAHGPGPSPGGRFHSGFPLWDGSGRILVSWSQCRLLDTVDPTRIVPCTDDRLADPERADRAAAVQHLDVHALAEHHPAGHAAGRRRHGHRGRRRAAAHAAARRHHRQAVRRELDRGPRGRRRGTALDPQRLRHHGRRPGAHRRRRATTSPTVSNPANAQYANRLARFIRIEKPVSIPDDDDIADPDNSAFGPTGVMREIVAYAPVEPDGSVRMKVPANVAFQISVLDANGRRVSPMHRAWLSVRPGEVLECNGCHTRAAAVARTRGRTAARVCSTPPTPAPPRPAPHSPARSTRFPPKPATPWRARVRAPARRASTR